MARQKARRLAATRRLEAERSASRRSIYANSIVTIRHGARRYEELPDKTASRIVELATRLLSERDRDRWAEELAADLAAVAAQRASRWTQVMHSFRVLVLALSLRRALHAGCVTEEGRR
ncbi:hypothetical protein GCM10023321_70420 [Pseudonocardia eucalypti]|uniref:Uncharacterized protein n=1 Tax=Pseudonocardia eucalypti TaxID=648755 RepID=A0ABP9R500_9PSEU